MTYEEVLSEYKEQVLPTIVMEYELDGEADIPARREAWNNFTDCLCKDNLITSEQYNDWECPW